MGNRRSGFAHFLSVKAEHPLVHGVRYFTDGRIVLGSSALICDGSYRLLLIADLGNFSI